MGGCKHLNDQALACLENAPSLRILHLESCCFTNEIISHLPLGLQTLHVRRCMQMWGDLLCAMIGSRLPKIVSLDLRGVPGLTNGGISILQEELSDLRLLKKDELDLQTS